MTPDQLKRFYLPIWLETARRMDWRMQGGRLIADLDEQLLGSAAWPDHARALVVKIIVEAGSMALQQSRAVNADDLRKACNMMASGGRTASSKKFAQRDLNHFDRLCAVLKDPFDLTGTIAWLNPAEDNRKRTLVYLRKLANEGRLRAIALNAWGTHDIETLTQAQLDSLTAEIKKNAWSKYPRKSRQSAGTPF